jgi:hypothetical protein
MRPPISTYSLRIYNAGRPLLNARFTICDGYINSNSSDEATNKACGDFDVISDTTPELLSFRYVGSLMATG